MPETQAASALNPEQLNRIDAVSKADVRRVANKVFITSNRTYAMIEFQAPPKPATTGGGK